MTSPVDEALSARARQVHAGLLSWAAEHTMGVSSDRLQAVALVTAVMGRDSGDNTLVQGARLCAITLEIDDIMDGPDSDPVLLEECITAARSHRLFCSQTSYFHIVQALEDLCDEIGSLTFRQYFTDCLAGMAVEYEQRREFLRDGAVPAFADYLAVAISTISTSALWAAMAALDRYPAGDEELRRAICRAGSACVRLANDLRGFRREVAEGKPNAVLIRMRWAEVGEEQARQFVRSEQQNYRRELSALVSALPPGLSGWGTSVLRFCDFVTAWYDVAEMAGIPSELAVFEEALDVEP